MSIEAPETVEVTSRRVACDGNGPLGHPRVWMVVSTAGWVECPYCDRKFVLKDGVEPHEE